MLCVCVYELCMYVCMYVCMYACRYVYIWRPSAPTPFLLRVCVCACACACTYLLPSLSPPCGFSPSSHIAPRVSVTVDSMYVSSNTGHGYSHSGPPQLNDDCFDHRYDLPVSLHDHSLQKLLGCARHNHLIKLYFGPKTLWERKREESPYVFNSYGKVAQWRPCVHGFKPQILW